MQTCCVDYNLIGVECCYCWYTANIVNISDFNALSIGGGLTAAVLLCIKRGRIFSVKKISSKHQTSLSHRHSFLDSQPHWLYTIS